ncbi:peptidase family C78 [Ophiocordyceps sinensis CO18]|uniref:Peptidase family C78 n=1 Tax=Ophiocordyceps sinensis (strain Co18 / CGMCC 3.14243) TaxID=911162 RepID=T5AHS3_OPHSC|nr:peptidase family C78 [Ophiocordyceps sinensis CO18]
MNLDVDGPRLTIVTPLVESPTEAIWRGHRRAPAASRLPRRRPRLPRRRRWEGVRAQGVAVPGVTSPSSAPRGSSPAEYATMGLEARQEARHRAGRVDSRWSPSVSPEARGCWRLRDKCVQKVHTSHELSWPWIRQASDDAAAACLPSLLTVGHVGLLPVLEQLLQQSPSTKIAHLCHPCVRHVSKLPHEGGFCGYRNVQTLVSYLIATRSPGSEHFGNRLPTVLEIQDLIEQAWDKGYNPRGRLETGGIKQTRKFIGTPEAQALFNSLDIPCSVQAFRPTSGVKVTQILLETLEDYFNRGWEGANSTKVRSTKLPPVFLQHQGHSVTVIGIERQKDNQVFLVVFDPSHGESGSMKRLIAGDVGEHTPKTSKLLKPYQRGIKYLGRHDEFEMLR